MFGYSERYRLVPDISLVWNAVFHDLYKVFLSCYVGLSLHTVTLENFLTALLNNSIRRVLFLLGHLPLPAILFCLWFVYSLSLEFKAHGSWFITLSLCLDYFQPIVGS